MQGRKSKIYGISTTPYKLIFFAYYENIFPSRAIETFKQIVFVIYMGDRKSDLFRVLQQPTVISP